MKRKIIHLIFGFFFFFSQASNDLPQSPIIYITNPGDITITLMEGEDFASINLLNAWDMDRRDDIGYWVNISNVVSQDGVWKGVANGIGYFFPFFQGFSTPINDKLSQELIWNKIGADQRYAINPQKYDLLSYRISVEKPSDEEPSQYFVRWTASYPVYWPSDNSLVDGRFGSNDGCYTQNGINYWPSGWRTYFFDLSKPNGDPGVRLNNWKDFSLIRGIRIDPLIVNPTTDNKSQEIKIDWIRLTSSQSSPVIPIKWNLPASSDLDKVEIWVTTNPQNNQEVMPLVRLINVKDRQYNLYSSIFPPGSYYFKLKLMDGSAPYNGCGKVKGESEWVGPLIIEPMPIIEFISPSALSGEDYATTEVGNPWDMTEQNDIITPTISYPMTINRQVFSNGVFCAFASVISGQGMSDSQIWLNTGGSPNNYSRLRPIDTQKYRFFSVRLKVDLPDNRDMDWAVRTGWGSRLVWWNNGIKEDGSETKYGFLKDGWNIYTIDLHKSYLPATLNNPLQNNSILTPKEQNPFPAQRGWKEIQSVKFLRFDPLETLVEAVGSNAEKFCIDWVLLTTENKVKQGEKFVIKYKTNLEDQDWEVNLFYTIDPVNHPTPPNQFIVNQQQIDHPLPGNNYIYLPVITRNFGADSFPQYSRTVYWDTSNVMKGSYFICAEVSKLSAKRVFCGEYPITIE